MTAIDPMVPPEDLIFIGADDFKALGNEFLRYFITLGGLQPGDRVLDVGCGIGRMAIPLTQYLDAGGSYEGFDIVPLGIDWCRERITPRHPRFRFRQADVFNKSYHPAGRQPAARFLFPYASRSFDFAFLTSVFTHMLPADLENYLAEIARVLKPQGRCLITYFLLNAESRRLIADGTSQLSFIHGAGVYRCLSPETPENAIAYDEDFLAGLYEKYGLRIDRPVQYGSWCARPTFLSYQDVVTATKVREVPAARRAGVLVRRLVHGLRTVTRGRAREPLAVGEVVRRHIEARKGGT